MRASAQFDWAGGLQRMRSLAHVRWLTGTGQERPLVKLPQSSRAILLARLSACRVWSRI